MIERVYSLALNRNVNGKVFTSNICRYAATSISIRNFEMFACERCHFRPRFRGVPNRMKLFWSLISFLKVQLTFDGRTIDIHLQLQKPFSQTRRKQSAVTGFVSSSWPRWRPVKSKLFAAEKHIAADRTSQLFLAPSENRRLLVSQAPKHVKREKFWMQLDFDPIKASTAQNMHFFMYFSIFPSSDFTGEHFTLLSILC